MHLHFYFTVKCTQMIFNTLGSGQRNTMWLDIKFAAKFLLSITNSDVHASDAAVGYILLICCIPLKQILEIASKLHWAKSSLIKCGCLPPLIKTALSFTSAQPPSSLTSTTQRRLPTFFFRVKKERDTYTV